MNDRIVAQTPPAPRPPVHVTAFESDTVRIGLTTANAIWWAVNGRPASGGAK